MVTREADTRAVSVTRCPCGISPRAGSLVFTWACEQGSSRGDAVRCWGARDAVGVLQRQRDLVVWKLNGLDDDRARGMATGTGLTIHGIVRHLTDVERSWLRRWFDGQQGLPVEGKTPGWVGGLDARPDDRLVDSLESYVAEAERCGEVVRSHSLDDLEVDGPRNLRWVLHHLIEETARHLGHLDVLCEMADGRTGEQPS